MSTYAALAEPNRRENPRSAAVFGERSVGDLVDRLDPAASPASPSTSRCCARPGSSTSATRASKRLYALRSQPLAEVDAWLEPTALFWVELASTLSNDIWRRTHDERHP